MSRLIIVSNKLPFEVIKNEDGVGISEKTSGISHSLYAFYKFQHCLWVGWDGNESIELTYSQKAQVSQKYNQESCYQVDLTPQEVETHHHGFCNKTIWPLFHYFVDYCEYNDDFWIAYKNANLKFAEKVLEMAREGDKVWVHDFHLLLLPKLIKEANPKLSIGFFLHIPFPSFEIFRLLPWRKELIEGMLGADLVAFHAFDYERHFMSCVRRLLGFDNMLNTFKIGERIVKIDNFPMGIDYNMFQRKGGEYQERTKAKNADSDELILRSQFLGQNDGKIMLSIDRLDYAKGIPNRLNAYEQFLLRYPELHGKICLVLFVIPSRGILREYQDHKKMVDETVGRINGQFGNVDWIPIRYFYRPLDRDEAINLYALSDIAFFIPYRDGMNLTAKEYVATRGQKGGVLILSETIGAAKEMSESILVNPNNQNEIVEAIHTALHMPADEQQNRFAIMQKRLKLYNEEKWAGDILQSLDNVKKIQETNLTRKVSTDIISTFKKRYNESSRRVIFLDYDGTLTGFHNDPQKASPDEELYNILDELVADEKNRIIIISGRDKETLGKWFEKYKQITFIAEHGVWVKENGEDWGMLEQIDKKWMDILRPTIEFYVDRTPRSLLEEKNYSLVWHYRHTDPDLGQLRAWELKDEIRDLISNLNLEIMDGDKVIEIKNSGVNKGRAAAKQLVKEQFDFIMALGDDWTDEYTFGAMPNDAFTVKVGTKTTKANYYTDSVESVRGLLSQLTK